MAVGALEAGEGLRGMVWVAFSSCVYVILCIDADFVGTGAYLCRSFDTSVHYLVSVM